MASHMGDESNYELNLYSENEVVPYDLENSDNNIFLKEIDRLIGDFGSAPARSNAANEDVHDVHVNDASNTNSDVDLHVNDASNTNTNYDVDLHVNDASNTNIDSDENVAANTNSSSDSYASSDDPEFVVEDIESSEGSEYSEDSENIYLESNSNSSSDSYASSDDPDFVEGDIESSESTEGSEYSEDSENIDLELQSNSDGDNPIEQNRNNSPNNLSIDLDNLDGDCRSADEMLELLHTDPLWTRRNYKPIHVRQFAENSSPNLPEDFDTTSSPIKYFQLFFSDEVLNEIVENTNKYVIYHGNSKRVTDPRYVEKYWKTDLTVPELKAFLGICIIFGLIDHKRYRFAWSSDPFLENSGVKRIMSLKRYQKITEYFHVNDREKELPKGHRQYDELGKVRWLIEHLNEMFPKYMNPTRQQSIDEGLIKYCGRCKFVQYMKNKPVKRGIKLWVRADARRHYCQQFKVYLGKGSEPPSKTGVYFEVVWDLVKCLQGKNYFIYFDNLYSSVPLVRFLYSKGLYSTGTIRKNSKYLPNGIKSCPRLPRGEYRTYQSRRLSNLTTSIWWDTKEVRFVSTQANPEISGYAVRRVSGDPTNVTIPSIAQIYNLFYSGVDGLDQKVTKKVYGDIGHSSKKMWKHIFFYLVNISIANSFILYNHTSTREQPKQYDHFSFRLELAKDLIGGFSSRKRKATNKQIPVLGEPQIRGHQLCHMYAKRPKRCIPHRIYKPNGKAHKDTVYGCSECRQHMCAQCFRLCH